MSLEQNKAIVLKFYEAFDQQDIEQGLKLMSADIVARGLDRNPLEGRDAVMQYGATMFAAFPDGRHILEEVIVEGDQVVTRGIFQGTHQGELMGIPPTGKQVTFSVIHIDRVENGKIVEHWGQGDVQELMQQLGIMFFPSPTFIPYILKNILSKVLKVFNYGCFDCASKK
ncbi:ester cyclase [Dapis sp. BLCC M126]|uniref:ester cyclase n=1 Tax=Dapis sp. BLCC M126 TaxID=3400189 RepID=UPI003CFAC900